MTKNVIDKQFNKQNKEIYASSFLDARKVVIRVQRSHLS